MLARLCPVHVHPSLSATALCILLRSQTWLTCQLPPQKPVSAFSLTACSLWWVSLALQVVTLALCSIYSSTGLPHSSENTSSQGHPCSHSPASLDQITRPHCLYSTHIAILKLLKCPALSVTPNEKVYSMRSKKDAMGICCWIPPTLEPEKLVIICEERRDGNEEGRGERRKLSVSSFLIKI